MDNINWKKGDVLETAQGKRFMFGHYEFNGFWVHRITKAGTMDNRSLGLWISKEGVKRVDPPRPHRWSGAGYVCADCGAIKDTRESDGGCPGGSGVKGFDVWLYHAGAGWWLDESEIDDKRDAARVLAKKLDTGNIVAGAVLPSGNHLGLFTKQATIPVSSTEKGQDGGRGRPGKRRAAQRNRPSDTRTRQT